MARGALAVNLKKAASSCRIGIANLGIQGHGRPKGPRPSDAAVNMQLPSTARTGKKWCWVQEDGAVDHTDEDMPSTTIKVAGRI